MARVERHRQAGHRIGFRANHCGHLLEMHEIVSERRMALQSSENVAPEFEKPRRFDPLRKSNDEQRRIVVAKIGGEPREAAHHAARFDRQRQNKKKLPGLIAPGDDRGLHILAHSDIAIPARHPVEGLERRACRVFLESPPVMLDCGQVVMNRQLDVMPRRGRRHDFSIVQRTNVRLVSRIERSVSSLCHGNSSVRARALGFSRGTISEAGNGNVNCRANIANRESCVDKALTAKSELACNARLPNCDVAGPHGLTLIASTLGNCRNGL